MNNQIKNKESKGRRGMSRRLERYRNREIFFQILRDKGQEYVDSKTKKELCIELIESGIPSRVQKGKALLIRSPLSSMISTNSNNLDCGLGYLSGDLKSHIEGMFLEGMSWGNHGEWHVDHIKSVSKFISDGIYDPCKINALSNLQPLWAKDNLSKASK